MNVLIFVGAVLIAYGLYLEFEGITLIRHCKEETVGTLVGAKAQNDFDRGIGRFCYVPLYSFMVNDKEYVVPGKEYKKHLEDYMIGTQKTVKYCATNPEICIIGGRNGRVGAGIILFILGGFAIFFGLIYS